MGNKNVMNRQFKKCQVLFMTQHIIVMLWSRWLWTNIWVIIWCFTPWKGSVVDSGRSFFKLPFYIDYFFFFIHLHTKRWTANSELRQTPTTKSTTWTERLTIPHIFVALFHVYVTHDLLGVGGCFSKSLFIGCRTGGLISPKNLKYSPKIYIFFMIETFKK